jgi:hypothetical protein
MSLRGKIASDALTDTGKVREHNEDMIGTEVDIGLFVLADGMGGYNAGEVASGIAVKTIINLVRDAVLREDLSVRDPDSPGQQDHLPHLEDPAAMRGHGHDGGRVSVPRQQDVDSSRR